jgi:hypothetical protein
VEAKNVDTNTNYFAETNNLGLYQIVEVPVGVYRIIVGKQGFSKVVKPNVEVHVQDLLTLNFSLPVGSIAESVTVEGGASMLNTTDASVSTLVDQTYIKNMPLNGRSFQDLILLTPGVTTNTPQQTGTPGGAGEFNVNGQRTEANYYTVDGVSANSGIFPGYLGASNSGSVASSTALGTTQSLVSVDALEEFRIQSSTYSAAYGRNPGGQFSFVTRSGTNRWHGTLFDYLRNNFFDANDWFNDYLGQTESPLRQNDFGGTLGGPIKIPHLYDGKDKTFFFFSYEGLRLIQPQPASINVVPTGALRQSVVSALQPVLNAFPLPHCPNSGASCKTDIGNGLGDFIGTWSNPNQIDAFSARLDHTGNDKLKLFLRFGDTPSGTRARANGMFQTPSMNSLLDLTEKTYTLGGGSLFSSRVSNDVRLNYSSNEGISSTVIDSFGGGQAVDLAKLQGLSGGTSSAYGVLVEFFFPGFFPGIQQKRESGAQRQWNLVDTVGVSLGAHQLKFGADYRRSAPIQRPFQPTVTYVYGSVSDVQANSVLFGIGTAQAPAYPIYTNFSAFVQDEWRIGSRLNISMGLRWEVNPAPGAANGVLPYTVRGSSLSTLALSPQGTPLWNTSWYNFAPRLGAAYVLRSTPRFETVLRGGGGVFFDTGQQAGSLGYVGPGFAALGFFSGAFPAPLTVASPAIVNPPIAPYGTTYAFSPHLQLPYTIQWNGSIQQALGESQSVTVSYVGANGRRLLENNEVNVSAFNSNFNSVVDFYRNGLTSDYNALQLQFQRRISRGLQTLASYTWSHSIDYGSNNASLPYLRASSDFDVRHSFSGAFSYDLPDAFQNRFARAVLHHWGLDDRFTARTGFPVTLNGNLNTDPATGNNFFSNLDLVPGQPVYIYGSQCAAVYNNGLACPGGRAINPNAFSPPSGNGNGNAPRNFTRGFGAWQMDFAVRREFPIYERLKLQFRAEAFNIFNHPSYGAINANYCSSDPASSNFSPNCTFGQATATLAQSLGVLSPLYQVGGPRSMQFALKLAF